MRRRTTTIWTIYGQIEGVVAEAMVAEKKFNKIAWGLIPPTQAYNDAGHPALFAVVVPMDHVAEFERRVAALRA